VRIRLLQFTVYVPGTPCTNIESSLWAVKRFFVYVTEKSLSARESSV
jgi:hypothetical protein